MICDFRIDVFSELTLHVMRLPSFCQFGALMSTHVAGVLLHITSLPSQYPCGSLGASAHQFLHWMSDVD